MEKQTMHLTQTLSPELRDRILARLEQERTEPAYRLLTPSTLRQLGTIQSTRDPIVSLYLELTPERRLKDAWHVAFKDLVRAKLERLEDRRLREQIAGELERIELALQEGLPALGRGVAFFVCESLGLWRQIALPIPLPDRLELASTPYTRPLVRTRDEHDRFVVALLSREHSRFFISQIGYVEEVLTLTGPRLRGMVTDWIDWNQRDDLERQLTHQEGKALATIAALIFQQFEARYLLFSAPEKLKASFLEHLPKAIRAQVGGVFSVEVHAPVAQVATAIEPVQRAVEAREEMRTLERIQESLPERGVWGIEAVIDAINQRRVMTVAVDDALQIAGGYCPHCDLLVLDASKPCPVCGQTVEAEADLVDRALEMALAQDATIELVRSDAARTFMAQHAPMGALLRF
ncbi:baeRF10 domain-containing protein [Rhodothermus profundi]|uniref:Peptide chain release factor 1 (ERF1) n=1 Tax=Rhodothermus profundi TaxID=633813 RepID=A0A1M6TKW7_9BACT|nr:peptide chain release factor 1 [Rhodothermus profundi]SHK57553.1 Peptide chain release factor 1 (eRF1) [Rhodothermus profundi]